MASWMRKLTFCVLISCALHTLSEGKQDDLYNDDLYEQQTALFEEELKQPDDKEVEAAATAMAKAATDPVVAIKRTKTTHKHPEDLVEETAAVKVKTAAKARTKTAAKLAATSGRRRYSSRRRRSLTVSYSNRRRRYGISVSYSSGRRRRRGYYDDNDDSGGACFPSKTIVHSKRHGKTAISNLAVGDMVLTHHGYAEVLFFAVHKPKTPATFLKITTANSTLVLTSSHAVFKKDGTPTLANKVRVGDELLTAGKVMAIKAQRGVGLVAPVTASGALVADGVATSDYGPFAHKYGQGAAHSALVPVRMLRWMFPKWSVWHQHEANNGHHPIKTWGSWLLGL